MRIQKILRKDSRNVIITFDNDEVLFLAVDIFVKSGLRKNDEISDDRFLVLIKENKLFHIKQRAFRYLGKRLHSTSELRVKLIQKGYEKDLIENVLEELKKKKYLDDAEFARLFVDEKVKLKLWGEKKLKIELMKRGINNNIITETLQNKIPDEINLKHAMTIAEKKFEMLVKRNSDKKVVKIKLFSFLSSRGYDYDIVKDVCNKLIRESDEPD